MKSLVLFVIAAAFLLLAVNCRKSFYKEEVKSALLLSPERYRDSVFSSYIITYNQKYRDAPGDYHANDGMKQDLYLDFWEPAGDAAENRPCVIMMHGGGFAEGYRDWMNTACSLFVQRGYTVANIGYRVDSLLRIRDSLGTLTAEYARIALYRALQDARVAISYVKSRAAEGRIDTNKIIMAGASAGAITSINVAYLGNAEVAAVFNQANYGKLDSFLVPGYSAKVKAAVAYSGICFDTNYIQPGDVPSFWVHSTGDDMLPIGDGVEYVYNLFFTYGPLSSVARLQHLGIPTGSQIYTETFPARDKPSHGRVLDGYLNSRDDVQATTEFLYNTLNIHQ